MNNDENDIKNLIKIEKSLIKQKLTIKFKSFEKQVFKFYPIPDYEEVINEVNSEKSNPKKLMKECKNKKVNKQLVSLAFFLINLFVVIGIFVYQFVSGDVASLTELFALKPFYRYLFLALAVFFILNLVEALKFYSLIKKSTGYSRVFLSYKTIALGRYYDCITPLSTGGQPFQMFYLKSRGVKTDTATAIPLVRYLFFQFAWIAICSLLLIFNAQAYLGNGYVIQIFAWLSLLCNIGIMASIMFLSRSKRIAPIMIISVLKLLNKMHIIKDYKQMFKKVLRFVKNYQTSFKLLIKNPFQILYHVILNAITIILNASIAYCIYLSFNANGGFGYLEIVTNILLCDLATGMVPLPGAAGVAEISFAAVFAKYFPSNTLVWAMLFWRIFSYFGYILQGVIILIYDYFLGDKKAKYYNHVKRFAGNKNYISYKKCKKLMK